MVRAVPLQGGTFIYPEMSVQLDLILLATLFRQVWEEIKTDAAFANFFNAHQDSFSHLFGIIGDGGFMCDKTMEHWLCMTERN